MIPSHLARTLLKPQQAAARLNISPGTLAIWRTQGKGPMFLKLGGAVRYDPDALTEYLARLSHQSTKSGKGKDGR